VSDRVPVRVPPDAFVRTLWAEVERHPAVAHPFLRRFAEGGLARWQIWGRFAWGPPQRGPRNGPRICIPEKE
jgi:hypothetical protein